MNRPTGILIAIAVAAGAAAVLNLPAKRSPLAIQPVGVPPPLALPAADVRLLTTMPAHDFHDQTLETIIGWIASKSPVTVAPRWGMLGAIDGLRDKKLTIRLGEGTLESALDASLFDDVFAAELAWRLEDGRIVIMSAADDRVSRRYDVADLLARHKAEPGAAQTGGYWRNAWLTEMIEGIDPLEWSGSGANVGTVGVFNGSLLVTARSRTQLKVQRLLWQLSRGV
jgi:hypothetical protein